MSHKTLESAHHALQSLKNNPDALKNFHRALSDLSAETGVAFDDDTFAYIANTLVNQRNILSNESIRKQSGTVTIGGFNIKAAIKTE